MEEKKKKKTRHKTTVTKELIQQVEELSEQGFNNILISSFAPKDNKSDNTDKKK